MNNKLFKSLLVTLLMGWMGSAHALSCPGHSEVSLTGVSACELGSTNNDFLNPLQVNADAMFGFNDWTYDAKDNDVNGVDDGANGLALSLLGGATTGTWSIAASAFSIYDDIMLVFKSGNGNPDAYVAYLLNATGGDYQSPFINPNNGNLKNISHVSIYVRGSGLQIVEPGILSLLGISLIGFAVLRRRS